MDRGTWWAMVHAVIKESDMTERLNHNLGVRVKVFWLTSPDGGGFHSGWLTSPDGP